MTGPLPPRAASTHGAARGRGCYDRPEAAIDADDLYVGPMNVPIPIALLPS